MNEKWNSEFEKAKEQFLTTFSKLRQDAETFVREDLRKSKDEALHLAQEATRLAQASQTAAKEILTEAKVEMQLGLKNLQSHLTSDDFEKQLDALIKKSGREEVFHRASAMHEGGDEAWFAKVHGSLYQDPFEKSETESSDAASDLGERRARVGRKLAFLFKHYRDGVIDAAKTGAFLGSFLNTRAAVRVGMAAGGVKLILVVAGIAYAIYIADNSDWFIS